MNGTGGNKREAHGVVVSDWPTLWDKNRMTCCRCGVKVQRGGTNWDIPVNEFLCRDCKDVEPCWGQPWLPERVLAEAVEHERQDVA